MKENKYEPTRKFFMDLLTPIKKQKLTEPRLNKLLSIEEEDS